MKAAKSPAKTPAPELKPIASAGHAVPGRTYIAIEDLVPSKTNPRRFFDPDYIAELGESIRVHPLGIIQPIVVRRLENGKTEIIAGECRYRAAKLIGMRAVPIDRVDLNDQQVLETQLIENLQRKDPHPLDEADGFAKLLAMPGYSIDVIAEKTGKHPDVIRRRLQLSKLIEPAKQAFFEGRLNIAHATRIVRLVDEGSQLEAFKLCFPWTWKGNGRHYDTKGIANVGSAELDRLIAQNITLKLKATPWKLDDPDLLPSAGSCKDCTKRAGANPGLFDTGEIGKDDLCMDPSCFKEKQAAFVQLEVVSAKTAGDALVMVNDYGEQTKGALERAAYTKVEGKRCEFAERAIYANGTDLGKKLFICRSEKCKVHRGGYRGTNRVATPEEKRRRLEQRIEAKVREESLVQIVGREDPAGGPLRDGWLRFITEFALDRAGYDGRRILYGALGIECKDRHDDGPLKKYCFEAIHEGRGLAMLIALASSSPYGTKAETAAKLVGVNVKALRDRIARPLREKATKAKKAAKKKAAKK